MTGSHPNTDNLHYLADLTSLIDPDLDPIWQAATGPFILSPAVASAASTVSSISFASAAIVAGLPLVEDTVLTSDVTGGTAAKALAVNVAVADYTVPGSGATLNGAGLKIGILSDSFNLHGGEASAISNGDLPAASMIHIVQEGTAGQDEGLAMAEIIHSIAPDAQIYFYTATTSQDDFATGITALANDGCSIIVDDVVYTDQPFYQTTGTVTEAVEAAIAKGVSYFSAAGNSSNNFYEAAFNPITVTLSGVGTVTAHNVGTSSGAVSPYEQVVLSTKATLDFTVEWAQPFSDSATDIGVALYSQTGSLVANYTTTDLGGDSLLSVDTTLTNTAGTYELVFYESAGTENPGTFKIVMFAGSGATINGYGAGIGSGTSIGQQIAPGVNTVAAVDYTNTPAYGVATPVVEGYSGYGPGEAYLSSTGSLLATPISHDGPQFAATDGSATTIAALDPFFGSSAAAPAAAAVGALVLQADTLMSNTQLTYVLEQSAIATASTLNGGAGLIQANVAVGEAVVAATTPIWQSNGGNWSTSADWTDNAAPGTTGTVIIGNGLGTLGSAYTVTLDPSATTVAALGIDGEASTLDPTLLIGASNSLVVSGAVTLGYGVISDSGKLTISGGLNAGSISATGTISAGDTGDGTIDLLTGTLIVSGDQTVLIDYVGTGGMLTLTASGTTTLTGGFTGGIGNFASGDLLELSGLTYNAADGITYQHGDAVIYDGSTSDVLAELALSGATDGLTLADDRTTGGTVILACYAAGTGIATPAGDVAVEDLRIGQTVMTVFGTIAPVVWIGHRHVDCFGQASPESVLPVRIRAHSFGPDQPYRDLLLSPEHAVLVDGVLIPAAALVDGAAIAQVDVDTMTYYHVQLATHDVLLAEGLPCDSYRDVHDHSCFDNAVTAPLGRVDLAPCAPYCSQGPALDRVRRMLRQMSETTGLAFDSQNRTAVVSADETVLGG